MVIKNMNEGKNRWIPELKLRGISIKLEKLCMNHVHDNKWEKYKYICLFSCFSLYFLYISLFLSLYFLIIYKWEQYKHVKLFEKIIDSKYFQKNRKSA